MIRHPVIALGRAAAWILFALAVSALLAGRHAGAQSVGGNASIAVGASSANVQLPASTITNPYVFLAPAVGTTSEIFYALGTSNSVVAVNTGPALPAAGLCLAVGPNTWVAAIGTAGANLRITQISTCPLR